MLTVHLLGRVEVHRDDEAVDLGGPQQRAVIAHLALDAGRVVPVDRLIDRLWGDEPPRTPLGTLQSYISRLRRAIEPERSAGATPELLVSEAPGYVLRVAPEQVDIHRFRTLVDEGRRSATAGLQASAIDRFDAALALWRGPALAGIGAEEQVRPIVVRLDEERQSVVEDRFDVLLGLGRHAEIVPDLQAAVAEDPLRERIWAQLATALYRSSRQADALRALSRARETLLDQLGLDPGPELRELEQRILDHDSGLLAASRPVLVRPVPAALVERAPVQLVGRVEEWAAVVAALEDPARPPLVLVEGEPGIGKSTMVEAALAHATTNGWRTALGRGVEAGLAPSLWPCLEIVRSILADAPEHVAATSPLRVAVDADRASAARWSPVELAEHFVDLIDALGDERWLIVLDDLHWADRATLDLVTLVAERLGPRPVRVVATHRPPELMPDTPFVAALGDLARAAGPNRVRIAPLGTDEVAQLVEIVTGTAPADDVAKRVHQRAGGNPLFVAELARLAGERGLSDETVVPDAIRDVVRGRLSRLPRGTLAELEVAAVLGERFDLRTVMAASERDADASLDALDPAIATRILLPDGTGFRFAHALVRDAVLAEVTPLRRARLHDRAADAIVRVRGEGPDEAEPIAHHRLAAATITDPVDAGRAAVRAADVARWRGALDVADRFAERALAVVETAPRTPAVSEVEIGALESLAGSAFRRNDPAGIDELAARIRATADRTGSDAARALELFLTWGQVDETDDLGEVAERTEQARALAERTTDPYATIVTRYMSASFDFLRGDLDAAASGLDLALAASGTTAPGEMPRHVPLVNVPIVASLIAAVRGEADVARMNANVRIGAWLAHRGEVDDTARTALAFNRALIECMLDEPPAVRTELRDVPRIDTGGFVEHQGPICELLAAWAEARLGDATALTDAFDALAIVETGAQRVLRPFLRSVAADACLACGDDRAVVLLAAARLEADTRGERWWSAETLRLSALADVRWGGGELAERFLADAESLATRQGARLLLPRIESSRVALVT